MIRLTEETRAALRQGAQRGLRRGLHTCWVLFRVTVPTYVAMDLLARFGMIAAIGRLCSPIMGWFRLPGEAAVPLLLGWLVNVYSAAATLGALGLSTAQILTLGLMVGLAHSVVVETAVLQAAGARGGLLLAYRMGLSVAVGMVAARLLAGDGA